MQLFRVTFAVLLLSQVSNAATISALYGDDSRPIPLMSQSSPVSRTSTDSKTYFDFIANKVLLCLESYVNKAYSTASHEEEIEMDYMDKNRVGATLSTKAASDEAQKWSSWLTLLSNTFHLIANQVPLYLNKVDSRVANEAETDFIENDRVNLERHEKQRNMRSWALANLIAKIPYYLESLSNTVASESTTRPGEDIEMHKMEREWVYVNRPANTRRWYFFKF